MVPLNKSLATDYRLWPQDIRGSQAWAMALVRAGVLTEGEGDGLVAGLAAVAERLAGEDYSGAAEEDIHSLVERLLAEEVGALAGKLHTGRSRNDQVSTDLRLWTREAGKELDSALHGLLAAVLSLAQRSLDVLLAGYTHLQQAQTIRGAHWALSHFWPLLRDRERLRRGVRAASVLPLGAGALAGCPFPVDREWLRSALGFETVSENSLDAVADRDWVVEVAAAGALLGIHLSRLGEDLVVFSSAEFGYLRLDDGYCTGSSLMPQKRNPDVAELVRGKAGRLVGNLVSLLTMLKGLPSGYNRDLQEDKEALFDTVDTLLLVLPPLAGAIRTAEFRADLARSRMAPELLATDLADYLVRKGVPFRESHRVVGQLIRMSEEAGRPLSDLPLGDVRRAHPAFEEDVKNVFSFEASVDSRAVRGGAARGAVREQLSRAEAALGR